VSIRAFRSHKSSALLAIRVQQCSDHVLHALYLETQEQGCAVRPAVRALRQRICDLRAAMHVRDRLARPWRFSSGWTHFVRCFAVTRPPKLIRSLSGAWSRTSRS